MARSLLSTYRRPGAAQLLMINHSLFITNSSSGAARLGCEYHDRPRRLVLGRPLCRPPLSPPSALTSHTHTRVHASLEEHRLPLGPLVDPQDRRRPQICLDAQERPHTARYPPCTSKAIPAARGGVPTPPSSRALLLGGGGHGFRCAGGGSEQCAAAPTYSCRTSAREDTYSAVLGRIRPYSLYSPPPSYSRGALNSLHKTVSPPSRRRTQRVGRYAPLALQIHVRRKLPSGKARDTSRDALGARESASESLRRDHTPSSESLRRDHTPSNRLRRARSYPVPLS